jgi:hypothetical protein
MSAVRVLLVTSLLFLPLLALGCSNPSDDENEPPTADEKAAFCVDVANTRNSLADVRDALLPLDEEAMKDARADTRASVDYLEGSSLQLQGGADAVEVLKEDLFKLPQILATPSLVRVADDFPALVGVNSTDLYNLQATGGSP